MKKSTTNKGINTKRIQEIINYDYYLGGLTNINIRYKLALNPIAAQVGLATLKELRKELDGFNINIKEIDCNRIFGDIELTETEVFIRTVCNYTYINYKSDFDRIKEVRELDKVFPREERQKLANKLEEEIKTEYRKIETIGKINKNLRKASEEKVKELGIELRDVLATLEVPTEDYINNSLWAIADSKINEIKNRLDYKITYFEEAMEEIA